MLTKDQICRKFLDNPNINPEKGTGLRRGYGPFNNYVNLCRELGYDDEVDALLGSKEEPTSTSPTYQITVKPVTGSPVRSKPVTNKFLTDLIDTDKEILKNLDLETLKDWIINDAYVEDLTIKNLPEILERYTIHEKERNYHTDSHIIDFATDLFKAGKYKLVKMIIDYFSPRRNLDFHYTSFYVQLFNNIEIKPSGKDDFKTLFALAPKSVLWYFLNLSLKRPSFSRLTDENFMLVLIKMINDAKTLGNKDIIDQIKVFWNDVRKVFIQIAKSEKKQPPILIFEIDKLLQ